MVKILPQVNSLFPVVKSLFLSSYALLPANQAFSINFFPFTILAIKKWKVCFHASCIVCRLKTFKPSPLFSDRKKNIRPSHPRPYKRPRFIFYFYLADFINYFKHLLFVARLYFV